MTEPLNYYIKQVHDRGFNISMMINTYKKKQADRGATYIVPDEVYISVCEEYIKRGDEVRQGFPYFMRVLVEKSRESCAGRSQEYQRFGEMAQNIKQIMKSV